MPGKKHLRGAAAKEQRQYEHILEGAKEEGRYGKRAKEVAARTVMKEHKEEAHKPHRTSSSGRTTRKSTGRKRTTRSASKTKSGSASTRRKTSSRGAHPGRSSGGSSRRSSGSRSGSRS